LGDNRYKRAAQLFEYENKNRLKSHIFSQEQYCFSEKEINLLLNDNFKQSLNFNEEIFTPKRKLSFSEEQALFDMKYYLQDDLLVKVDRASMQHSLEVRVPLIDYRLVHFALNLKEDLRKQKGITKFLLKEVLYDLVPKPLFDRPKWGFGIPLGEWLQKDWKFLIDKYLNKSAIEGTGIFNYQLVNQIVQRFLKGETYLYNRIWLLIIVQKNLRKLSRFDS
jgi:asparagine synthase (glutamine-hydrolysing)